jgi:hypothetical protein
MALPILRAIGESAGPPSRSTQPVGAGHGREPIDAVCRLSQPITSERQFRKQAAAKRRKPPVNKITSYPAEPKLKSNQRIMEFASLHAVVRHYLKTHRDWIEGTLRCPIKEALLLELRMPFGQLAVEGFPWLDWAVTANGEFISAPRLRAAAPRGRESAGSPLLDGRCSLDGSPGRAGWKRPGRPRIPPRTSNGIRSANEVPEYWRVRGLFLENEVS